jgi:DNA-binding transcriptional LysR family regulator
MELRHLRYFLVVGEVLNFTKAAAHLRVAQPPLSRPIQDLEDEIGVDLLRRSSRGVTLTAEGKLFLDEVRELLNRLDESVEKTRALARGEYGELHIGYIPIPTAKILPRALEAFRKAVPRVKLVLHDLSTDELIAGLRNGTLELAIMVQPIGEQTAGIEFETLRSYVWCVALSRAHPLARLKSIPLEKLAGERLVILSRKSYSEYHRILEHIFAPVSGKPRIAMECDSESSLFMEVKAGRAIAVVTTIAKLAAGKRLTRRASDQARCIVRAGGLREIEAGGPRLVRKFRLVVHATPSAFWERVVSGWSSRAASREECRIEPSKRLVFSSDGG